MAAGPPCGQSPWHWQSMGSLQVGAESWSGGRSLASGLGLPISSSGPRTGGVLESISRDPAPALPKLRRPGHLGKGRGSLSDLGAFSPEKLLRAARVPADCTHVEGLLGRPPNTLRGPTGSPCASPIQSSSLHPSSFCGHRPSSNATLHLPHVHGGRLALALGMVLRQVHWAPWIIRGVPSRVRRTGDRAWARLQGVLFPPFQHRAGPAQHAALSPLLPMMATAGHTCL